MIKKIFRIIILILLNLIVIYSSSDFRVDQLLNDIDYFYNSEKLSLVSIYLFISTTVSFATLMMIYFLKPFIEVYLMYYLKYSFYFLINLVSISTIYIVLRLIGYSRVSLLAYLVGSSFLLYISDKKLNFFHNK